MDNYLNHKNILKLVTVFFIGSILFGIINYFVEMNKGVESFIFLSILGLTALVWVALVRGYKNSNGTIAESKFREIQLSHFVIILSLLLGLFFLIAFAGTRLEIFRVGLFGGYKEFGHHVEVLFRMTLGSMPWVDFTYSYGIYPMYLAYVIWKLVPSIDALVIAKLILDLFSIFLFLYALKKNVEKKYFFIGAGFIFLLFLPQIPSTLYSGIHSNLLRYLSPLLLILLMPDKQRIYASWKAVLLGFCTGFIFLSAQELLPISAFMIVFTVLYLFFRDFKKIGYFFSGLFFALAPVLIQLLTRRISMSSLISNIFYHAKFIILFEKLTIPLPDVIKIGQNLLNNPSALQYKDAYFDVMFYLPVFLSVLVMGALVKYGKKLPSFDKLIVLSISVISIFAKSLGFATLSYAMLALPIAVFSVLLLLSDLRNLNMEHKAPSGERVVLGLIIFFTISYFSYTIQQVYFPCLISDNEVCRDSKNTLTKGVKIEIDNPKAGQLQRYDESEVRDFERVISFLAQFDPTKVLNFSDFVALDYYLNIKTNNKIVLPSMYYYDSKINGDLIDIDNNIEAIIFPQKGYNYLDFNLEQDFKTLNKRIIDNYYEIGRCRGLIFYVRKDINNITEFSCEF